MKLHPVVAAVTDRIRERSQAARADYLRLVEAMASRGRGSFLNDKRLRVSRRTRLADSLIGTGFPFRKGVILKGYVKM